LDTTFGEDASPVRDVPAAHNFSLMREFAVKLPQGSPSQRQLEFQATMGSAVSRDPLKMDQSFVPCF